MKKYKIWIQVAEVDDSKDHYENIGEPLEAAVFKDLGSAELFAESLAEEVEWRGSNVVTTVIAGIGRKGIDTLIEHDACEMTGEDCVFVNLADLDARWGDERPDEVDKLINKVQENLPAKTDFLYLYR